MQKEKLIKDKLQELIYSFNRLPDNEKDNILKAIFSNINENQLNALKKIYIKE